jgi:hypothetical protein
MRLILGCAAALAAVMVTAGPAAAAPLPKIYDYEIEIRGAQTNKWSHDHANQGGCDVDIHGSGRETVKFSSRPLHVKIMRGGGTTEPFTILPPDPTRGPDLPLRATVKRSGSISTTGGEVCSYGDGTGDVRAQGPVDCGTKKASGLRVSLRFLKTPKNMLYMTEGYTDPADPFQNCPGGSGAFPDLLHNDTHFNPIGHRFNRHDLGLLFAQGKFELIAHGTKHYDDPESSSTTSIWWAVSFKKLGKKH